MAAILRSASYLGMAAVREFVDLSWDDLPTALRVDHQLQNLATASLLSLSNASAAADDRRPAWQRQSEAEAMALLSAEETAIGANSGSTAAEFAGAVTGGRQDKWRKLFINMRMKIKPHEIAVCSSSTCTRFRPRGWPKESIVLNISLFILY